MWRWGRRILLAAAALVVLFTAGGGSRAEAAGATEGSAVLDLFRAKLKEHHAHMDRFKAWLVQGMDADDPDLSGYKQWRALASRPAGELKDGAAKQALLVEQLALLGDVGFGVLFVDVLKSKHQSVRALGARVIGRYRVVDAVGSLLEVAKKDTDEVALVALEALGRIGDERTVAPLMRLVKSGKGERRIGAMGALGAMGAEEAVELLIKVLGGGASPQAAAGAAAALGALGDPYAFPALLDARMRAATSDPENLHLYDLALLRVYRPAHGELLDRALGSVEPEKRAAAARMSGLLGYDQAVSRLAELTSDLEPSVRREALAALWRMHDCSSEAADSLASYCGRWAEALGPAPPAQKEPPRDVTVVVTHNRDEFERPMPGEYSAVAGAPSKSFDLRDLVTPARRGDSESLIREFDAASVALSLCGVEILAGLVGEEALAQRAVVVVAGAPQSRKCEAARGLLGHADQKVRLAAVRAVAEACPGAPGDAFFKGLASVEGAMALDERLELALRLKSPELLKKLLPAFGSLDIRQRGDYLDGVVALRGKASLPLVMKVINDPSSGGLARLATQRFCEVGSSAKGIEVIRAVASNGGAPPLPVWSDDWSLLPVHECVAKMVAGRQRRKLMHLLKDRDAKVRSLAALMVSAGQVKGAKLKLRPLLKDDSRVVRGAAVIALAHLEGAGDISRDLGPLLRDPASRVRRAAIWALATGSGKAAVPALLQLLEDNEVSGTVVEALGRAGNRAAVESLMFHYLSTGREGQRRVLETLAVLGDPVAVELFSYTVLNGDPEVRMLSVRGLAAIGGASAGPALVKALSDPHDGVRSEAATGLGVLGHKTDALVRALGDPSPRVRLAAVRAAGRLKLTGTSKGAAALLSDDSPDVRHAAFGTVLQLDDCAAAPLVRQHLREWRNRAFRDEFGAPSREFSMRCVGK